MLKKILFILLVSPIAASAQVYIVPRVGCTAGTYSLEPHSAGDLYQERVGLQAGLTTGIGVAVALDKAGIFSFKPEVNLVQKGYSKKYSGFYATFQRNKTQLMFLEMPLLLQVHRKIGKMGVYLTAGPSFGFGLGGKQQFVQTSGGEQYTSVVELKYSGHSDENPYDRVVHMDKKHFSRIDVAAQIGIGTGVSLGPGNLILEARFGIGFVPFYKDLLYTPQKEKPEGKSRTLVLTAGYSFPLR